LREEETMKVKVKESDEERMEKEGSKRGRGIRKMR
jgi:hypothetical protein